MRRSFDQCFRMENFSNKSIFIRFLGHQPPATDKNTSSRHRNLQFILKWITHKNNDRRRRWRNGANKEIATRCRKTFYYLLLVLVLHFHLPQLRGNAIGSRKHRRARHTSAFSNNNSLNSAMMCVLALLRLIELNGVHVLVLDLAQRSVSRFHSGPQVFYWMNCDAPNAIIRHRKSSLAYIFSIRASFIA